VTPLDEPTASTAPPYAWSLGTPVRARVHGPRHHLALGWAGVLQPGPDRPGPCEPTAIPPETVAETVGDLDGRRVMQRRLV